MKLKLGRMASHSELWSCKAIDHVEEAVCTSKCLQFVQLLVVKDFPRKYLKEKSKKNVGSSFR